jgi:hypothetical protein
MAHYSTMERGESGLPNSVAEKLAVLPGAKRPDGFAPGAQLERWTVPRVADRFVRPGQDDPSCFKPATG